MLQPALNQLSKSKIILASSSPRRKTILDKSGLNFDVCTSLYDEDADRPNYSDPLDFVKYVAKNKGLEVAGRLSNPDSMPDLIIAADTMIYSDKNIYGKPKTHQDAYNMLKGFSGKKHKVCTGVCLFTSASSKFFSGGTPSKCEGYNVTEFQESTTVCMAQLTDDVVNAYIATGEPMDKAGGYGIQHLGASLVESIEGDFFNVMGFPLHQFCIQLLKLLQK